MSLGKLNIDSITSGYRTIHSGGQYNKYFKTPEHDDRIVIQDGNVNDTVELDKAIKQAITQIKGLPVAS